MRHGLRFKSTALALLLLAMACFTVGQSQKALAQTQSPPSPSSSAAQDRDAAKRAEIDGYTEKLKSSDDEERREAVLMLGAMRDPATIPALSAALNDAAPRVRAIALHGLSMLHDASLVPLIANSVTKDKLPFVRKAGAYALGEIGSPEGTPTLITALRDKDLEVRGAAVVSLAHQPDASAIAPLISALEDKSEFVRAHAAAALGINSRAAAQAVPNLVKMLTSDKDPEARRQAAAALGLIGEPSALPALEHAIHSSDPYLSQAAREAIPQIRKQ